jgi:hypothetical protein
MCDSGRTVDACNCMRPLRSTTSTSSTWCTKARTLCALLLGMVRWSPTKVSWLQLRKGVPTQSSIVACGCTHASSFLPLAGYSIWQICMRSLAQCCLSSRLFLFIPWANLQLMHKIYFGVPIWLVLRTARKVHPLSFCHLSSLASSSYIRRFIWRLCLCKMKLDQKLASEMLYQDRHWTSNRKYLLHMYDYLSEICKSIESTFFRSSFPLVYTLSSMYIIQGIRAWDFSTGFFFPLQQFQGNQFGR